MSQSMNDLWNSTLHNFESTGQMTTSALSWIKKSSLFKIQENTAWIIWPNGITKNILEANRELIEQELSNLWGSLLHLEFISEKESKTMNLEFSKEVAELSKPKENPLLTTKFNPTYTFESFIEGSSNQEAYAAALNCCHTPAVWNPLMIYGNPGLGKTHLLHAIGNYLKQEKPESKIIYMYGGDLVTTILDAMKAKNVTGNKVEALKEQLLDCDYFLIDDIQNIKQNASQEVFFTVYNKLVENQTQIIMTSDVHPETLEELQSRLVSRFVQGLAVNIVKPGFETSKAILKKKMEGREEDCLISDDVIDYLATKCARDVRSLEGSLNQLLFKATLFNPEVIDLQFAKENLQGETVSKKESGDDLTINRIKKTVARYYGLAYKELEGKSRQKKLVLARHVTVYLCKTILSSTYSAIGQELGNRDHTTMTNSYDRAKELIASDPSFAEAIEELKDKICGLST